jgi:hypothetical protein
MLGASGGGEGGVDAQAVNIVPERRNASSALEREAGVAHTDRHLEIVGRFVTPGSPGGQAKPAGDGSVTQSPIGPRGVILNAGGCHRRSQ